MIVFCLTYFCFYLKVHGKKNFRLVSIYIGFRIEGDKCGWKENIIWSKEKKKSLISNAIIQTYPCNPEQKDIVNCLG